MAGGLQHRGDQADRGSCATRGRSAGHARCERSHALLLLRHRLYRAQRSASRPGPRYPDARASSHQQFIGFQHSRPVGLAQAVIPRASCRLKLPRPARLRSRRTAAFLACASGGINVCPLWSFCLRAGVRLRAPRGAGHPGRRPRTRIAARPERTAHPAAADQRTGPGACRSRSRAMEPTPCKQKMPTFEWRRSSALLPRAACSSLRLPRHWFGLPRRWHRAAPLSAR